MDILADIAEQLLRGEDAQVADLTRRALQHGISPKEILDAGLIAGMTKVGAQFKCHELYLPDVLMAAQAMNAGLEVLKPLLIREGIPTRGRIVLGSVQGDLHDIGKNLVGVMLKGAGYEVIDLGSDVPPEQFIATARQQRAAVIGMSALLTTTMLVMGRVVQMLREQDLAGKIKTIIGGAPVTEKFAREISADAYGYDAASAVERVGQLIPALAT